ncbi:PREDICTED: uncharacterized protein LOC105448031 [Wasmannia auropunctata]|uniref:uncharacterized protein LOC105448031 n=1 Tax=Wasmannia auropunctata TaxID=64793 RepID=UPI0005EE7B59|nr:PREDICTED: uncharacterized protein LOC105448031 [Wasmannia auropunctata]
MPLLLFGFMACGKYGNLLFHEKDIRRCLNHIEEDYRFVTSAKARDTMIESAKVGIRLVALCALFMYGSGLSFRLILPFAKGKIITAQNVTIRPLPCPAYFIFFNVQVSPIYELIFAIQVLSGMITYSITTGLCGLAAVFVMHACGQLTILMNLMRNLVEVQEQKNREVDRKLALMEWENSNSLAMSSYFSALISMMLNMFMFCYTGEQLTVQAEKVARTSCVLEWYRLPDKKARAIVLVIIMSNLPIKITAGNIVELSLKTYGDIVKTAVTYFNMLLKVTD